LALLAEAIQRSGREDAAEQAERRVIEAFPWDIGAEGWEGTGINPTICTDCASIAAKALAVRDVLPADVFVSLYGPFHRVVRHPQARRPPWVAGGAGCVLAWL
jgi:hypothetical protein